MTGFIFQRNGVYYVRLKYTDFTGHPKEKWVSTGMKGRGAKRLAQQKLDQIIREYAYLERSDGKRSMLFSDYLKHWQVNQKDKVELSTYEGYLTYFDRHLVPYFAARKLTIQQIKPYDIQQFVEYKLLDGRADGKPGGLGRDMVKKLLSLLRQVFDYAVMVGDIEVNPAARIRLPPANKDKAPAEEKIVFLNQEEAQKLLDAFAGDPLEAIIYLTLYFGLRRSEVLGLKWSAVDFDQNTITIKHVVVKNRTVEAKDSTKTYSSRRTFEILPEVREMLLHLKEEEQLNRAFFGNCYIENDYVFKHDDGTPYRPDSITRSFQRTLARHGLKHMRFHDLRHSTASILFDKGWDINQIKEWLGHSDIETTANIYTHLSRAKRIAMAKDMEGTFTMSGQTK